MTTNKQALRALEKVIDYLKHQDEFDNSIVILINQLKDERDYLRHLVVEA